jgi:hypothetical protein
MKKIIEISLVAAACFTFGGYTIAATINVPAADSTKTDLGFFPGGVTLSISASGTAIIARNFLTQPDGSLASPMATSDKYFSDAASLAASYPIIYGGDGINHFIGGGLNYSTVGGVALSWPVAGKMTTDTTAPGVIRFGALIGTFSEAPKRADWFLIGRGATVTVPLGGRHLYVLVNDSYWADNSGGYWITVAANTSQEVSSQQNFSSYSSAPSQAWSPAISVLPHDDAFGYKLPSDVGLAYSIEASSDLVHWVQDTNVALYFRDFDSANYSQRFYRFERR